MGALGVALGRFLAGVGLGLVERATKRLDPAECARLRNETLARISDRAWQWNADQQEELGRLLGKKG